MTRCANSGHRQNCPLFGQGWCASLVPSSVIRNAKVVRHGRSWLDALATGRVWCRITSNNGRQARGLRESKHEPQASLVLHRGHDRFRRAVGRIPGLGFGAGECPAGGGRHRQRRHRRRGARPGRARSRRVGDRGDDRTADEIRQDGRDRRPGALRHPRPAAERELQRLGARLRAGGFAQAAREARPAAQSHGGAGAERGGGGALLSGDLLVHDDEDSAGEGFRRHHRYPEEHHPGDLAPADGQRRLHRLPSARSGIDAHDPGRASANSSRARTHGCAASPPAKPASSW